MNMKKLMVVAIFFLLLSLVFVPGINANKASINIEKSKISVEICGIDNSKQYVACFTEEDSVEIENLTHSIGEKFHKVETWQESIETFNEAVLSLNEYDLLPKDTDVENFLKVMSENYAKCYKFLDNINPSGIIDGNIYCLITGNTDSPNTRFINRFSHLLLLPVFLLEICFGFGISLLVLLAIWEIIDAFPVSLNQMICLGQIFIYGGNPATGWIHTTGLNGIKNWEGDIYGGMGGTMFGDQIGVIGFKGIKITNFNSKEVFYMGFARRVKVEDW